MRIELWEKVIERHHCPSNREIHHTIKSIKKHHFKLMVTSLQTENSIYDIEFNKKIIVIGNESNGVSPEIQDMADEKAKIPMLGKTESLNASVATAIPGICPSAEICQKSAN